MKFFGSYTYETVKYIKVEDSRLGCLRLILLLGIVLYVGVIEMAYMGGYLEATRVVGAVRLSLQQPRQGSDCSGLAGDFVMNNYASIHMNRFHQAMGDQDGTNCTNSFAPLNTLPYCEQSLLTRDDPNELMEVDQSLLAVSGDPEYRGSVFPCQIYEAINAQVIRESSIVVWTRATTQNQTLVCGSGVENTCPQTYEPTKEDSDDSGNSDSNQNQPFYVAQSEAFTLLFEHAATASHICETKFEKEQFYQSYSESGLESESSSSFSRPHYSCSAQAVNYPKSGRLLSLHHGLCQEANAQGQRAYAQPLGDKRVSHAPCYILPNRTSNHLDFFALDVLLKAAGILSLDDCVEEKNNSSSSSVITVEEEKEVGGLRSDPDKITNATCTTFRESGATILLTVLWNDFMHYKGIIEPYYHYKARIIGTSYKETQAFYSEYRNSRVLFNAHGIKVAVVVGGNFHQFTWLNFIITITTALGMLAVATAVVDAFMLHILPEKDRYQECKYERVARPSSMLEEEDQVQPQPGVEDGVEGEQGQEGQHTEQWWQQREPLLAE